MGSKSSHVESSENVISKPEVHMDDMDFELEVSKLLNERLTACSEITRAQDKILINLKYRRALRYMLTLELYETFYDQNIDLYRNGAKIQRDEIKKQMIRLRDVIKKYLAEIGEMEEKSKIMETVENNLCNKRQCAQL